jgi:pilus assembly protein CpaB
MPEFRRPFPAVTGQSRRARWRRHVLRRVGAATLVAVALWLVIESLSPSPPPAVTVVAAVRPVAAGAMLGAGDLAPVRVPAGGAQPGALTAVDEALGRRLAGPMLPGETLTRSRLVPSSVAEGLPSGTVAVHLIAADPAVLGLLRPGHLVTLVPSSGGRPLARGATVLSTDPAVEADGLGLPAGSPARGLVVSLPAALGERVVAGHGGIDGPPVVNVVAVGGP